MVPFLLLLLAIGLAGLGASAIMTWASGRSPLCNMALGGILAAAALGGAIVIAWLLTRAAYP